MRLLLTDDEKAILVEFALARQEERLRVIVRMAADTDASQHDAWAEGIYLSCGHIQWAVKGIYKAGNLWNCGKCGARPEHPAEWVSRD